MFYNWERCSGAGKNVRERQKAIRESIAVMKYLCVAFFSLGIILLMSASAMAQRPESQPQPQSGVFQKMTDFFDEFFRKITKEEKEIDPSGTLVAPFAEKTLKPLTQEDRYKALVATNNVAVDQPHRSDRELGEWLMHALAQTLSFDSSNFNSHLPELANGFSPAGLEQFKAWAIDSGILGALESNGMQLNGFVTDVPFLLNQGTIAGRFRWLYEVPVMVSFVPRGTTLNAPGETAQSNRLLVTLQLGRRADSILEHGVQIESWSVRNYDRKN